MLVRRSAGFQAGLEQHILSPKYAAKVPSGAATSTNTELKHSANTTDLAISTMSRPIK